jgi:hypothetical protein
VLTTRSTATIIQHRYARRSLRVIADVRAHVTAAMLVPKRSAVALLVGGFAYAALRWLMVGGLSDLLHWWFGPQIPTELLTWFKTPHFWTIYGYAMLVVPGVMAGLIAHRAGLLHGAIVGAMVPLIDWAAHRLTLAYYSVTEIGPSLGYAAASFLFSLVQATVLCALGGLAGAWVVNALRNHVSSNSASQPTHEARG